MYKYKQFKCNNNLDENMSKRIFFATGLAATEENKN